MRKERVEGGLYASRRRHWFTAAALTIGVLTLQGLIEADVSLAGPTCADGRVCFWERSDFEGFKITYNSDPSGYWTCVYSCRTFRSAKNRFGNRKVSLRWGGPDATVHCMDPGEEFRNLLHDHFRIGGAGSRC